MQLHISQSDWGDAQIDNIASLLKDTASHLNRLLRTPFKGTIYVAPSPPGKPPRAIYRSSPRRAICNFAIRPKSQVVSICLSVFTRVLSCTMWL